MINGKQYVHAGTDLSKKILLLYQIFNKGTQSSKERDHNDALEFFSLLIHELADPVETHGLKPLWHEIIYLNDRLQHFHQDFDKKRPTPIKPA
jgi:hypothetical protein